MSASTSLAVAPRVVDPAAPPVLHSEHERAHVESLAWAARMNLVEPLTRAWERCAGARFAWLAAATFPGVTYEQLRTAADAMVWFFLFDDEHVTATLPGGMA